MPPPKGLTIIAPPKLPSAIPDATINTPAKSAPLPKGLTIITPGLDNPRLDVLSEYANSRANQPLGDQLMAKAESAPINDDEKAWLKENERRITPEQFQHSLDVFSGKQASTFITHGQYYYDADGIPQQIKFGQASPELMHTSSIFGSQLSAEDDSFITTGLKSLWNSFIDIAKLPATVAHLGNDLFGIDETKTPFGDIPNQWERTVQALEFETSTKSKKPFLSLPDDNKPFKDFADLMSHYDFNSQNVAATVGGAAGLVVQMILLGGGGLAADAAKGADVAAEGLSLSGKIAPIARKTGANTLYMLNSTYDEASKAGLKGRERFAVSLISAVGQGLVMTKMFPELPAGAMGKGAQEEISKSAIDAFVKASDGNMTSEALKAAYNETLASTSRVAPVAISNLAPKTLQALKTGSAMVINHAFDNGVLSLDAHLTGRTDDNAIFSPKAFVDYFNSFVSGTALGVVGSLAHKTPEEQSDNQSKMAYAYIREGRDAELVHNLNKLADNGQITPEQHADAIARVNGYKRYATETANVKLTDEEREQVFNNIFKDEKVKTHLDKLEADTTLTPAIREAQIKVLRSESTGYVNEIAKTMGRKETPAETANAADKTGEELPGENAPAAGSKAERRQQIVQKFTEANPEYKHHKAIDTGTPTENLQGRWTITNEGKKAQAKIKAGKADAHDFVEAKRYEAMKNLKIGDVLHIHRFLPEKGKKIQVLGRTKVLDRGYRHLLNAFDENGNQVGSIDYQEGRANDKLVNDLLDQGHEVKLIVSDVKPNGEIEYQIASKQGELTDAEKIRAEHTMPTEGWIRPRQLHEQITEHLKVRKPTEPVKKPMEAVRTEPSTPANELNNETPIEQASANTENAPAENVHNEEGLGTYTQDGNVPVAESVKKERYSSKSDPSKLLEETTGKDWEKDFLPIIRLAERKGLDKKAFLSEAIKKWNENSREIKLQSPLEEKEIDSIRLEENPGGGLKTPTGNPSKLNETQWKIVRTKTFKEWFGDWEKNPETASKVVDQETGEPLIVYHGGRAKFNEFSYEKIGAQGTSEGFGFYFTSKKEIAEKYASKNNEGHIFSVFLNIRQSYSADKITFTKDEIQSILKKYDLYGHNKFEDFKALQEKVSDRIDNGAISSDANIISFLINPNRLRFKGGQNVDLIKSVFEIIKNETGKDGIITGWGDLNNEPNIFISTNPNQIKLNTGENTSFSDSNDIRYQSPDNTEALAFSNPELQQQIIDHLGKLFPNIKVFNDAAQFQEFLDRNFPGSKLDLSKIGAAIGDAVYINSNRAVQSTAIHEHAHIYWDAIGDTKLKQKISALFENEEAAITAIGKLGTEAAKIKLSPSRKLKFLQYAKEFWSKVKNAFGIANKEDLVRIFASDLWKNAAKVEAIQSGASGPAKFQTEETTPQQQRVINQLQGIANNFDYDPFAHTYTLADTETEYKPVNDILNEDVKYKFKGKPNDIAGQRGNDLHSLAESLVKGEDFETALAKTKLKFTDDAKQQFQSQVNDVVEKLRVKGQLLPETIFANSYFKTAGRPDLPIVNKDGLLHIYDWKTSTLSTEGNKLYEEGTATTASKKDRDGTQIAMYAKLAEHGDPILGVEPQRIGEAGIIPIRLTIGSDGEITKVTVEPIVDVPYQKYKQEASRLLSKQHEQAKNVDASEFVYKGAKGKVAYMKAHGMDADKLESELEELPSTPEGNERRKEIYQQLENIQSQFELYQKQFQIVKGLKDADLSKFTYEQLVDTMNTINSYDSLLRNVAMNEIRIEAGRRMTEMETERLAKLGVKAGNEKDLPQRQVFFKALSDISEELPALQGRIRDYFAAKQAEESEHSDVDREARKLFADVIKDNGGTGFSIKGDLSKYFDNLFAKKSDADGPAVLKDWRDLSNNLKQSERVVLHFMDEKMSEFQNKQALSERGIYDGFYAEISPNFWEAYHRHGFIYALSEKLRQDQPEEIGDQEVTINVDGKKHVVSYSEAERLIADYSKKNILTKVAASLKLARAYNDAKKSLDKEIARVSGTPDAIKLKGAASRYTLNENGEMVSKFHWKRPEGKEVSYDVYRSFMSYMTDQIHIKHMQPLLPELSALEAYYKQRGNVNTLKFMEHWIGGDIFGKEFVGDYGRSVDTAIKFLQGWTYYNVMPFNFTLGKFNLTTGKLNQIRAEGVKKFAIGEKRYFKSFAKTQGILEHYGVVEPMTKGPARYSARNFWEATSNFFVSGGENSIRGAAFLSNFTDAEFRQIEDNFDNRGNIIDKSKDIAPGRIFQVKKMTEDIQGKYAFADKRMYKHYAGLRSAMMFKGWMLDFIKERFGSEYTDLYGVTHKGSYRSIPYTLRDLKTMMMNFNGTDVNAVNNRKNIREAMIFATMMGIYATTFGDDKSKREGAWLLTMTNDLLGPMNLSRTKTTIAKPFAIAGTVSNFIDAMGNLLATYSKDSKFGKEGDWAFPGKLLNVLPYNRVAKDAVAELENPDYTGN